MHIERMRQRQHQFVSYKSSYSNAQYYAASRRVLFHRHPQLESACANVVLECETNEECRRVLERARKSSSLFCAREPPPLFDITEVLFGDSNS